jgi:hypothetical protein
MVANTAQLTMNGIKFIGVVLSNTKEKQSPRQEHSFLFSAGYHERGLGHG